MMNGPPRLCALAFLALIAAGGDKQWMQFRGPNGSGVDSAIGYPVEFSPSKNVVWKKAIPYGQSSPVVAGGHVYLTSSEGDRRLTICLDAKTGNQLWQREIRPKKSQQIFHANDPASPTPVADESGGVAFFPDFGLAAYTPEGKDRWDLPLGPFKNFYGMAASPIVAGDLLVLVCDQQSGSFLLALDRKTGRQRWKTERGAAGIGWATPMVFRPQEGPAQLIVLGSTRLDSYYLDTGEQRWWMPLGSGGAHGTPVAANGTLFVSTLGSTEPYLPTFEAELALYDKDHDGRLSREEFSADKDYGEHFGWVDADGDNFITAEEWNVARNAGLGDYGAIAIQADKVQGKLEPGSVRWRYKKSLPYIPAPLIYQDVYYMVRTGGIITSLDPATGRLVKEGRSREAIGQYYASPVAADNKLFLVSAEGKMTVLKAAAEWEILAVNDLGNEIHATPALSGGLIYVRTQDMLYCFGAAH
jgi:outer membrane protein assembly factor BamB